jgi:hypothetical protein
LIARLRSERNGNRLFHVTERDTEDEVELDVFHLLSLGIGRRFDRGEVLPLGAGFDGRGIGRFEIARE